MLLSASYMYKALQYLDKQLSRGRTTFTTEQFIKDLEISQIAAKNALRRLRSSKLIASPLKGFHMILEAADRSAGSRSPDQFIDYLMGYINEPYYVAILSAAEIHGAAHHRPQVYQVMVEKNRRMIRCGNVRIQFIAKSNLAMIPTIKHKVSTGYIKVSSPEATAFDLVRYDKKAAGLDNVATVLNELAENISPEELVKVSDLFEVAFAQRLGYIFEFLNKDSLASALEPIVKKRARRPALLVPDRSKQSGETSKRWRLILNNYLEPDL